MMENKESYIILPNKIVYKQNHRENPIWKNRKNIEHALLLARKYKLPVVLKFTHRNMIVTPGEGSVLNNIWYIWRLMNLAYACEYKLKKQKGV